MSQELVLVSEEKPQNGPYTCIPNNNTVLSQRVCTKGHLYLTAPGMKYREQQTAQTPHDSQTVMKKKIRVMININIYADKCKLFILLHLCDTR